jgi:hypothetical protein
MERTSYQLANVLIGLQSKEEEEGIWVPVSWVGDGVIQ